MLMFENADCTEAVLYNANLQNTRICHANFNKVELSAADLRYADLQDLKYQNILSLQLANIYGIRNAPPGFIEFAEKMGAVSIVSTEQWHALLISESKISP